MFHCEAFGYIVKETNEVFLTKKHSCPGENEITGCSFHQPKKDVGHRRWIIDGYEFAYSVKFNNNLCLKCSSCGKVKVRLEQDTGKIFQIGEHKCKVDTNPRISGCFSMAPKQIPVKFEQAHFIDVQNSHPEFEI